MDKEVKQTILDALQDIEEIAGVNEIAELKPSWKLLKDYIQDSLAGAERVSSYIDRIKFLDVGTMTVNEALGKMGCEPITREEEYIVDYEFSDINVDTLLNKDDINPGPLVSGTTPPGSILAVETGTGEKYYINGREVAESFFVRCHISLGESKPPSLITQVWNWFKSLWEVPE